MLLQLGYQSMDAFVGDTVPSKIRVAASSVNNASIPALSESELQARAKALGGQNKSYKSYIGLGYHNAVTPPVILRNVCVPRNLAVIALTRAVDHGKPGLVYPLHAISA
jgi:glycine dehydrogenase